jgi:hypothetical protein
MGQFFFFIVKKYFISDTSNIQIYEKGSVRPMKNVIAMIIGDNEKIKTEKL